MISKRKLCVSALGSLMYALFYALGSEMEAHGACAMPGTLLKALLLWPLCLLALGAALLLASRPKKTVPPDRFMLFRRSRGSCCATSRCS